MTLSAPVGPGEYHPSLRILIVDNYDSFTHNLAQGFGAIDPALDLRVARNDALTLDDVEELAPDRIVLSPGPCTPAEAGVCNDLVRRWRGRVPILGVCLGHQCIGAAFGIRIVRAPVLMHGKASEVFHDGRSLFEGLPTPFTAARYHSLIVDRSTIPFDEFKVSAWTADGVVMGLRWIGRAGVDAPLDGVQFHPESFMTECGPRLLANFLRRSVGEERTGAVLVNDGCRAASVP